MASEERSKRRQIRRLRNRYYTTKASRAKPLDKAAKFLYLSERFEYLRLSPFKQRGIRRRTLPLYGKKMFTSAVVRQLYDKSVISAEKQLLKATKRGNLPTIVEAALLLQTLADDNGSIGSHNLFTQSVREEVLDRALDGARHYIPTSFDGVKFMQLVALLPADHERNLKISRVALSVAFKRLRGGNDNRNTDPQVRQSFFEALRGVYSHSTDFYGEIAILVADIQTTAVPLAVGGQQDQLLQDDVAQPQRTGLDNVFLAMVDDQIDTGLDPLQKDQLISDFLDFMETCLDEGTRSGRILSGMVLDSREFTTSASSAGLRQRAQEIALVAATPMVANNLGSIGELVLVGLSLNPDSYVGEGRARAADWSVAAFENVAHHDHLTFEVGLDAARQINLRANQIVARDPKLALAYRLKSAACFRSLENHVGVWIGLEQASQSADNSESLEIGRVWSMAEEFQMLVAEIKAALEVSSPNESEASELFAGLYDIGNRPEQITVEAGRRKLVEVAMDMGLSAVRLANLKGPGSEPEGADANHPRLAEHVMSFAEELPDEDLNSFLNQILDIVKPPGSFGMPPIGVSAVAADIEGTITALVQRQALANRVSGPTKARLGLAS